LYVQCPGCGHVAKIKLGKTHHSGNNKRGTGTFDINTKAATGAFYSCGIRLNGTRSDGMYSNRTLF
jgi:hypothetical protein